MTSQLHPAPILPDAELAGRMPLLAELQGALHALGFRCVLARNHKLVLRYNEGPYEPSGLTEPQRHIFLTDSSQRMTTDPANNPSESALDDLCPCRRRDRRCPVTVRSGVRRVADSLTSVPVPPSLSDEQALLDRLRQPHLEMTAWPGAVLCARHHARQLLWDMGLKELIEPVELVVSELVTNAVRASGGLDADERTAEPARSIVRLWVSVETDSVMVLVWDASLEKPQRQELQPAAESGRGLYLVELLSAALGCF